VGRDLLHLSFSLVTQQPVLAGRVLRERVCTSFPTGFPCRQYKNGALGSACFYQQLFVLSAYAPRRKLLLCILPPYLLQPSTPLSLEVQSEAMTLQGPYAMRTIV
jgi:hypothetical protein